MAFLRHIWHRLAPFGWGTITRLAAAYFFSTLYFYIPVGTLYLRGQGLTYLQIQSLWGIIVFTMFLTEVPTGMLADRIGHRRAINLALGFQVLGEVIYFLARGYGGFVLASIAGGLGFAFGSGCIEALVYDTLQSQGRADEMSQAVGYIEAAQRLANLLAFTIGGLLVRELTQARFRLAIALTAGMVMAGFLVSLSLKSPPAEQHSTRPARALTLLADGVRLLRRNRAFRRLILLSLITLPLRDYLGSLYQPQFVAAGVPPVWFGLALALASGLSVLGARHAHRLERWLGPRSALLLAAGLPGLLYLAMAWVLHPTGSVLVFCLLSSSMSLRGPILAGQLNKHIESRNRATVLSLISMASGLYVALMGLIVGHAADNAVPAALILIGVVILAGTAFEFFAPVRAV